VYRVVAGRERPTAAYRACRDKLVRLESQAFPESLTQVPAAPATRGALSGSRRWGVPWRGKKMWHYSNN